MYMNITRLKTSLKDTKDSWIYVEEVEVLPQPWTSIDNQPQALIALKTEIAKNPAQLAGCLRENLLVGFHVNEQGNIVPKAAEREKLVVQKKLKGCSKDSEIC